MTIPMPSTRPGGAAQRRVLVVCTGNSARSIMAEALFQTLGAGAIEVVSAGSAPTGQVHPMALEQIGRLPVDPSRYASKSLASVLEAATTPFDLVVTVCDHAAESCGTFPGTRPGCTGAWPIQPPTGSLSRPDGPSPPASMSWPNASVPC